jgi:hypothetical protein
MRENARAGNWIRIRKNPGLDQIVVFTRNAVIADIGHIAAGI